MVFHEEALYQVYVPLPFSYRFFFDVALYPEDEDELRYKN